MSGGLLAFSCLRPPQLLESPLSGWMSQSFQVKTKAAQWPITTRSKTSIQTIQFPLTVNWAMSQNSLLFTEVHFIHKRKKDTLSHNYELLSTRGGLATKSRPGICCHAAAIWYTKFKLTQVDQQKFKFVLSVFCPCKVFLKTSPVWFRFICLIKMHITDIIWTLTWESYIVVFIKFMMNSPTLWGIMQHICYPLYFL